jgi:hypothetical protein
MYNFFVYFNFCKYTPNENVLFAKNVPHIKDARCVSFEANRISSFENMQHYILVEITLSQSPWILGNQSITSIRIVILTLCVVGGKFRGQLRCNKYL